MVAAVLSFSAVAKSIRQVFARTSVRQSPACGSIPNAITLPSFVIEISDVPAPTSIIAMLRSLNFSGIATLMAAIGSSVRFTTLSPASSTAL